MSTEKKQITVSGILADLHNGLSRKDIREKYELTGKDMKEIFQHPKLRFRKARTTGVNLIDDTESAQEVAEESAAQEEELQPAIETTIPVVEEVTEGGDLFSDR